MTEMLDALQLRVDALLRANRELVARLAQQEAGRGEPDPAEAEEDMKRKKPAGDTPPFGMLFPELADTSPPNSDPGHEESEEASDDVEEESILAESETSNAAPSGRKKRSASAATKRGAAKTPPAEPAVPRPESADAPDWVTSDFSRDAVPLTEDAGAADQPSTSGEISGDMVMPGPEQPAARTVVTRSAPGDAAELPEETVADGSVPPDSFSPVSNGRVPDDDAPVESPSAQLVEATSNSAELAQKRQSEWNPGARDPEPDTTVDTRPEAPRDALAGSKSPAKPPQTPHPFAVLPESNGGAQNPAPVTTAAASGPESRDEAPAPRQRPQVELPAANSAEPTRKPHPFAAVASGPQASAEASAASKSAQVLPPATKPAEAVRKPRPFATSSDSIPGLRSSEAVPAVRTTPATSADSSAAPQTVQVVVPAARPPESVRKPHPFAISKPETIQETAQSAEGLPAPPTESIQPSVPINPVVRAPSREAHTFTFAANNSKPRPEVRPEVQSDVPVPSPSSVKTVPEQLGQTANRAKADQAPRNPHPFALSSSEAGLTTAERAAEQQRHLRQRPGPAQSNGNPPVAYTDGGVTRPTLVSGSGRSERQTHPFSDLPGKGFQQQSARSDVHWSFPAEQSENRRTEILSRQMQKAGLSRDELADSLGVMRSSIDTWLSGAVPVPLWVLSSVRVLELLSPQARRNARARGSRDDFDPKIRKSVGKEHRHPFAKIEEL